MAAIDSAFGPIKIIPSFSHRWAKAAFSDRNPYPIQHFFLF